VGAGRRLSERSRQKARLTRDLDTVYRVAGIPTTIGRKETKMPATVVYSLRLPVGVYEQLKAEAARADQEIAQILRDGAMADLAREEGLTLPDDPIWRLPEIAGELGGSGIANGAVHHDKYLYGRGKNAYEGSL
jgi:hypothetical protein